MTREDWSITVRLCEWVSAIPRPTNEKLNEDAGDDAWSRTRFAENVAS